MRLTYPSHKGMRVEKTMGKVTWHMSGANEVCAFLADQCAVAVAHQKKR